MDWDKWAWEMSACGWRLEPQGRTGSPGERVWTEAARVALLCSEVGEMSRAAEGAEVDCDVLGEGTVYPGGPVSTMS